MREFFGISVSVPQAVGVGFVFLCSAFAFVGGVIVAFDLGMKP